MDDSGADGHGLCDFWQVLYCEPLRGRRLRERLWGGAVSGAARPDSADPKHRHRGAKSLKPAPIPFRHLLCDGGCQCFGQHPAGPALRLCRLGHGHRHQSGSCQRVDHECVLSSGAENRHAVFLEGDRKNLAGICDPAADRCADHAIHHLYKPDAIPSVRGGVCCCLLSVGISLFRIHPGQVSINISKPGITKGQHWHNSKWEQFIVVHGHGLIQERNINTGETVEFEVSGDKIESIYMIPGWTHNIINLSDTEDLVTVMTCNEIFDPNHPDTFFEKV